MTAADLSPPEHEHTAAIDQAAEWLAATPPRQRPAPLVPALREMFGLSALETCQAIRQSHQIRGGANVSP
ncbi:hypothetical protein [Mesorhizobium sp. LjNodule214]|uniref:hypothetical protein n=1 Tax=Mesorhizobium sp. LjNodule214 TaxID=3342252 RepID=UPI003ECDC999